MKTLENYRRQIDEIDQAILTNIAKRVRICEEIGAFKREHGIPMMQQERVNIVLDNAAKLGESLNLRKSFVKKLYSELHAEIFDLENAIINADESITSR